MERHPVWVAELQLRGARAAGEQSAEKDTLKDRVKADTVKELLAVIDSFEMAKGQLKPEGEGEQRLDSAYQARR